MICLLTDCSVPFNERDKSQLLIYKDNKISKDTFRNIDKYLPSDTLLVFNNTRVIRARILFQKETGAIIEVLCLEPFLLLTMNYLSVQKDQLNGNVL